MLHLQGFLSAAAVFHIQIMFDYLFFLNVRHHWSFLYIIFLLPLDINPIRTCLLKLTDTLFKHIFVFNEFNNFLIWIFASELF